MSLLNATAPAEAGAAQTGKGPSSQGSPSVRRHRDDSPPLVLLWRRAVAESDLTSTQKLVAFTLSIYMKADDGSCFPAQETIATRASLGERAVRDALRTLDARGFIRREGGRGPGNPTRYTATVPDRKPAPRAALQGDENRHLATGKPASDDRNRHEVPGK